MREHKAMERKTIRFNPDFTARVVRIGEHWKRDYSETVRLLTESAVEREEETLGWSVPTAKTE